MNPYQPNSLPPSHFDSLYRADLDPWKFETSAYEADKYAATIAALPKSCYRSVLEIGGSIGVLTERLADRAEKLLSIDVSKLAQDRAVERCRHLPKVEFQIMEVPKQFPDRTFDLILVSEVGYYWNWEDLRATQQRIIESLEPGGHLLLVHWILYEKDHPLSGDEVHEAFLELSPIHFEHLLGKGGEQYRLDLFERL
jgi:SAM-dependent methyltransferase